MAAYDAPPPQPETGLPLAQPEASPAPEPVGQPPPAEIPKIPIKIILIVLGAFVLLGLLLFAVRSFLGRTTKPETVTLTYWGLWEDEQAIEPLIAEFEASHPGVEVNYVKQAKEDYRERLVNSLARQSGPDIFRFHNTWTPMLERELAPLPAEVMDSSAFSQTFYPVAQQDLRRGADLVGIPLMFDGLALFINEEIFSNRYQTVPVAFTWDELRKLALELTIKDEEGRIKLAGVALGRTDNVDHWQDILALMMLQNKTNLARPDECIEQTCFGADALSFFALFSTTDRVWDETMPPSTQAFAAGKLAMYFGPSWRIFEIKKQNPSLSFRVVPVPQLPKTNPSDPDITWASYWAEGVWSKSASPKLAWEFLKFLSERDSLQKIYQNSARTRLFGPIYPRPDMAALLESDPLVGAFVKQAPDSRSWYLASRTFDGPTGINSRISSYFEDAVNAVVAGQMSAADALPTVTSGVTQVLDDYAD